MLNKGEASAHSVRDASLGLLPSTCAEEALTDDNIERTAWWLLLAVLVLLPLFFLPTTIEVYVVPKAVLLWTMVSAAAAIVVVGDMRRGVLSVPRGPDVRALTAFCIAAAGATALSPNPFVSLFGAFMRREGLLSLLAYALVYVLVVRLAVTQRRVAQGVWALILPVAPMGAYAVAQSFGFEFVRELNPAGAAVRAYGALGNADFLGTYAALMLPVLVIAFLSTRGAKRVYVGLSLFLDVWALLFSYFRGGWLGAVVGMLALAVLLGRSVLRRRLVEFALVLAIIVLAVVSAQALRGLQSGPPEAAFAARAASVTAVGTGTAATRLEIWPRALGLVARRPLLGFGPESFRGQFMPIRGPRIVRLEGTARWDRPHNSLLYLAISVGLVGLACYLVFVCAVAATVVKARRAGIIGLAPGLIAGALGAFVAEFFIFWSPATTALIFAAMGLAVAAVRAKGFWCLPLLEVRLAPVVRVLAIAGAAVAVLGVGWIGLASLRGDYYADLGRAAATKGLNEQSSRYYDEAVDAAWWINDYRWRAAAGWERAGFMGADAASLARAAQILKAGLRIDPFDEQAYVQLGDTYRHLATLTGERAMAQAAAAYRSALRLDPFSPRAYLGLARTAFGRGDYAKAVAYARRGLRFDATNKDLLSVAGWSYEQLGDVKRARASFRQVLSLDPSYAPARDALQRLKP